MAHWLITGGAGFIGANFVHLAASGPAQLTVLDALTYAGNLEAIAPLVRSSRVRFVHASINDRPRLGALFAENDFTHVVHFAAESHVDRSILGADDFIATNVGGTFNLLEAARGAWKSAAGRRFLHVSTDEVFGDLAPDAPPATEGQPYAPSSPYAASKAASDHLVRAWGRTYGLPVVITNCSNNYGPWQFPEKLIPLIISNIIEERPLPVYGDGRQIRDWLHVEDHCEAIQRVLEAGVLGETYLVGGRNEQANIDVVHTLCDVVDEAVGRPAGSARKLIKSVADRPGHDRRYAIDPAKIERELGWRPRHAFAPALRELVAWYREHAAWVQSVRSGAYRDYYKQQYGSGL
jgi:dTDP-glucose 4,6-dehydratase